MVMRCSGQVKRAERAVPVLINFLKSRGQSSSAGALGTASSVPASSTGKGARDSDGVESGAKQTTGQAAGGRFSTLFNILKVSFAVSATAACAATGYVSYAYQLPELEEKMDKWRDKVEASADRDQAGGAEVEKWSAPYLMMMKGVLSVGELYLETRRSVEDQIMGFSAPLSEKLLPDLHPSEVGHVYTLVLDLNETLVYSDWQRDRGWRTFKRPGVDAFLEQLSQRYEIVVYSDQMGMYVDPVVERLNTNKGCIHWRLDRNATQYKNGKHLRDLSKLNRDPAGIIYIGAHSKDDCLQPENALQIKPYKLETDDKALLDLLPFLEYVASKRPPDLRAVVHNFEGEEDIAAAFRERNKQVQKKVAEKRQHRRPLFGVIQPPGSNRE